MKTVTTAAAVIIVSAGLSGVAQAQSMDDWTGFSVGVVGGALETDDDDNEILLFDRNLDGTYGDTVTTVAAADAFSPGFCNGQPSGVAAGSGCDEDKEGVEAAIRFGYDQQFGSFVVGAFAEVSSSTAENSVTGFSTTPASYTFKRNLKELGAFRLRAGWATGRMLVYATGGYAAGNIDNRFFSSNSANSFTTNSPGEDHVDGYQGGAGVEWKLAPNLSLITEYIYTSLDVDDPFVVRVGRGAAPATNPFILPPNTTGTDIIRASDEFNTHSFRIGMAYRF